MCAGVGHASSIVTLTNLARLGNTKIAKTFNMAALYNAALVVTERSTGGEEPFRQAELIGSDAMDQVFASDGMGKVSEAVCRFILFSFPGLFRYHAFVLCGRLRQCIG